MYAQLKHPSCIGGNGWKWVEMGGNGYFIDTINPSGDNLNTADKIC